MLPYTDSYRILRCHILFNLNKLKEWDDGLLFHKYKIFQVWRSVTELKDSENIEDPCGNKLKQNHVAWLLDFLIWKWPLGHIFRTCKVELAMISSWSPPYLSSIELTRIFLEEMFPSAVNLKKRKKYMTLLLASIRTEKENLTFQRWHKCFGIVKSSRIWMSVINV
jgi:hypothetical protein